MIIRSVRALAGEITTLPHTAAFATVKVCARHAPELILGTSTVTDDFTIAFSATPLVQSLNVPPTSNFAHGLATPIPIFPPFP